MDLGLFTYVPYIFESSDGEILFSLVDPFTGEAIDLICDCSQNVFPEDYSFQNQTYDYVVAIPKHIQSAELSGVLFPRYRQQTELTAAGYEKTQQRIETWSAVFSNLEHAISRVYQGNIKGISKERQG